MFTPASPPLRSLWRRAPCCGATISADRDRMGTWWADVHEPGCRVPWEELGVSGEPFEVYPGAPQIPDGARLRAVNRKPGSWPANREHIAAQVRRPS
jgi:hypothetical protein